MMEGWRQDEDLEISLFIGCVEMYVWIADSQSNNILLVVEISIFNFVRSPLYHLSFS